MEAQRACWFASFPLYSSALIQPSLPPGFLQREEKSFKKTMQSDIVEQLCVPSVCKEFVLERQRNEGKSAGSPREGEVFMYTDSLDDQSSIR